MKNLMNKLKKSDLADKITLIVAMILLVILFGSLNPNYVTSSNLTNILIACSLTGFVAIGETNLIIAGQNDLSAGSVAACAAFHRHPGYNERGARRCLHPVQRQGGRYQQ